MGAYSDWIPIFSWVLIHRKLECVADMGAYIHGCLYSLWVPIIPSIQYVSCRKVFSLSLVMLHVLANVWVLLASNYVSCE